MTETVNNTVLKSGSFGKWDYLKITILVFATTGLWQSVHSIILPIRILDFVPESEKNTYLGLLTFSGLILAMLLQPVFGAISDSSAFRMGRRRPFIIIGVLCMLLFLPGIGLAGGYAILFAVYCLMQISSNAVQGAHQGFIPDLVPEGKKGAASGVKSFMEMLGGVSLIYIISIFMGNYSAGGDKQWLWLSLAIPGAVLIICMLATVITVKEEPGDRGKHLSMSQIVANTFKIDIRMNRGFIWFLASRLCVFAALGIIQQFALYFLRDVVGVADPAAATARFTILAVTGMLIVVYPAGRLSDKIGRKSIAVTSAFIGAAGILLIIVSKEYSVILAAAGLIGIALGGFTSANWAMACDMVCKGEEARYLGIANMATAGAGALARLIGPVIDFFENQSTGSGYQVMLITCLALFLIGALILIRMKAKVNQEA
ncbi:MAG: MFS transporter [Dehalococcoidales bacterium]|nr:MFS transporter [Dehalococcoidales bacterium]